MLVFHCRHEHDNMGTLTAQRVTRYSVDCNTLFYHQVQQNQIRLEWCKKKKVHLFEMYASERKCQITLASKRHRLRAEIVWEQTGLFAVLTIFIHSEVDHLPGALTQWLDDSGQSVSSTRLLETILGAAAGPESADAANRVRPADTVTKTKHSIMASSSNRTVPRKQTEKLVAKGQTSFNSAVLQMKIKRVLWFNFKISFMLLL